MKNTITAAVLTLTSFSVSAQTLDYSQLRADFPGDSVAQEFVFKCVYNGNPQSMCTEMQRQFGEQNAEFMDEVGQIEAAGQAQLAVAIDNAVKRADEKRSREEVAKEKFAQMSEADKIAYVDTNLEPSFGQLARMGMWTAVDLMILGHMTNGDN